MKHTQRLAFSTLGCPDWSFETIVTQAKTLGFSAIELRGIGQALRIDEIPCLRPENQNAALTLLDHAGVKIVSLNTSASFHDPKLASASFAEARHALEICKRMGIPAIRVFGDARPVGSGEPAAPGPVIEGLLLLSDTAAQLGGIEIWLEVHGCFNSVERLEPILQAMRGCKPFGILWDIEHSFRAVGNDFMPFYEAVRPYLRHVHVKDVRVSAGEHETVLPGEGDIAIADIVLALERDGYAGYYSFEWEKRWIPELAEPEEAFPMYIAMMRAIGTMERCDTP